MKNLKIVAMWVFGAFCLLFASMIPGTAQPGLGVSDAGLAIALPFAFILFLLGGILWGSVAFAVKKGHEF